MKEEFVRKLEELVGSENFSTELPELYCYSRDFSFIDVKEEVMPDVVVWPSSVQQVSDVVKFANENRIPVVPRGAGTGESGAAMPVLGGIVLDFTKWNRVLDIDTVNMTCLVEPGIVCDQLNLVLAKHGFFFPPVTASSEAATVGGGVANNSGGYRTVKYGSFKNWVMGLEVVLPDGEVTWTGSKTRKTSTGYDLIHLFVGSEGTLGVFTKIRLRIHPLPETRKVFLAYFNNINDACLTIVDVMKSRLYPSSAEIMDKTSIKAVKKYGVPLLERNAMVIIELDGSEIDVKERLKLVEEIVLARGATETRVGASAEEDEELWKGRKEVTPAFAALKPNVIDEDIAIPVSRLPELFERIQKLSKELNIEIATYGHAGDGNLHPDILFDKRDPGETDRAILAVEKLREITIDLGGTITGEHGIGIRRAPSMRMEISEEALSVMRKIKRVLDPNNIMNPGKMTL